MVAGKFQQVHKISETGSVIRDSDLKTQWSELQDQHNPSQSPPSPNLCNPIFLPQMLTVTFVNIPGHEHIT